MRTVYAVVEIINNRWVDIVECAELAQAKEQVKGVENRYIIKRIYNIYKERIYSQTIL